MPLLSYSAITDYPFQPFTKIYSADINAMFSAIQTLLNTTKLDSTNVQAHGLTRYGSSGNFAAGTANYVIYNDSNGDLKESAQLPTAQGGLGADLSPSSSIQAGYAITVNSTGTGFVLSAASGSSAALYNYYNLS
jgi:hypothetical protein